jgi:nicotinamidase-related amidase
MISFEGRQIPNELNEIVDPKHTVLLVWDMQNDQAGGSFNKEALIRNAPPLIAAAAEAKITTDTVFVERRGGDVDSPGVDRSKGRSSEQTQATPH